MEQESIGTRIRTRRKELGFTQDELAQKVGVTYQAVSKWENDTSYPDIVLMGQVARALDASLEKLVLGGEPESRDESEKKRAFYGKNNRHGHKRHSRGCWQDHRRRFRRIYMVM